MNGRECQCLTYIDDEAAYVDAYDELPYIEGFNLICTLAGALFPGYIRRPPAAMAGPFRSLSSHVLCRWHSTVR